MQTKAKQELIGLLNQAIGVEYGALFLLPSRLSAVKDTEAADKLRALAREELEHAELTARLILQLGGTPNADFIILNPADSVRDMVKKQLEGEKRVIGIYAEALKKAEDEEIRVILRRLLADEQGHQKMLDGVLEKL